MTRDPKDVLASWDTMVAECLWRLSGPSIREQEIADNAVRLAEALRTALSEIDWMKQSVPPSSFLTREIDQLRLQLKQANAANSGMSADLAKYKKVEEAARAFDPTDDYFVDGPREEAAAYRALAEARASLETQELCNHNFRPVCRTWEQCTLCGERQ